MVYYMKGKRMTSVTILFLMTVVFIIITIESRKEIKRINKECDKACQDILDGIAAHKKIMEKLQRDRGIT